MHYMEKKVFLIKLENGLDNSEVEIIFLLQQKLT